LEQVVFSIIWPVVILVIRILLKDIDTVYIIQ